MKDPDLQSRRGASQPKIPDQMGRTGGFFPSHLLASLGTARYLDTCSTSCSDLSSSHLSFWVLLVCQRSM
jgi:hypothetical protein